MTWIANHQFRRQPSRDWFCDALQNARRTHGLTVKEVARRLGRTPQATERLLSGVHAPRHDAVVAACAAFDEVFQRFLTECGRARNPSDAEKLLDELASRLRERKQ